MTPQQPFGNLELKLKNNLFTYFSIIFNSFFIIFGGNLYICYIKYNMDRHHDSSSVPDSFASCFQDSRANRRRPLPLPKEESISPSPLPFLRDYQSMGSKVEKGEVDENMMLGEKEMHRGINAESEISYRDSQEGERELLNESQPTPHKRKQAKLVLSLIYKNGPIRRESLFEEFSTFYSEKSIAPIPAKDRKRRFDQIITVLKGTNIVKQSKKLIRVFHEKEYLDIEDDQSLPNQIIALQKRLEWKRIVLADVQTKSQSIQKYFEYQMKRTKEEGQKRLEFPLMTYFQKHGCSYVVESQLKKAKKVKLEQKKQMEKEHHQVRIRGDIGNSIDLSNLLKHVNTSSLKHSNETIPQKQLKYD